MPGIKLWYITILTIILLLTTTTSILAVQADTFEQSVSGIESSQYQMVLLLKLIENYNPSLDTEGKKTVCESIITESKSTGFDPLFISSIIAAESGFCPNAVSPCEALGLMQLTSCVSTAMHINDPFNIQENIYAGTRFLAYLKNRFGDNDLILAAYNAGPTRVARLGRVPRIKETLHYIKKVNSLYLSLRQELASLIQDSMQKLFLCQDIQTIFIGNDQEELHQITTVLYKKSFNQSPVFSPESFLCEAGRSIRLLV